MIITKDLPIQSSILKDSLWVIFEIKFVRFPYFLINITTSRRTYQIIFETCTQVGNAVTDNYYDNIGTVTYWWSHSMISDRTYNSIIKLCNFKSENSSQKCDDAVNYAMNHEFGDIDQYSIYTPSCKAMQDSTKHTMRLKNTLIRPRFSGYDPCTENYAEKYYNRPDVQKAMHANKTGIPYKWTACR